jgi:hypothetical protein
MEGLVTPAPLMERPNPLVGYAAGAWRWVASTSSSPVGSRTLTQSPVSVSGRPAAARPVEHVVEHREASPA